MKYFNNNYNNSPEKILVTAIGSFSAEQVIRSLKAGSHFVAGCDIYPKEWVANSRLTDHFRRAPLCSDRDNYVDFIKKYCRDFQINYVCPLIDPEVDILSSLAPVFESMGVTICTPSALSVEKIRNKLVFQNIASNAAKEFPDIFTIPTEKLSDISEDFSLPAVVKPINGRSSIGKRIIYNKEELSVIKNLPDYEDYIIQPYIEGMIVTVDALRDEKGNTVFSSRRELLRTVSGAGVSVETVPSCPAENFCRVLLEELGVVGCVNIEFIENVSKDGSLSYHVLEINPRFSGGVEFSCISGIDFPAESFEIFRGKAKGVKYALKKPIAPCDRKIIARSYSSFVMN